MPVNVKKIFVKCQDHMSWSRPEGVLLVGGTQQSDSEPETAELVSWDGSASEEKFNLSVIHRSDWSVYSPDTLFNSSECSESKVS